MPIEEAVDAMAELDKSGKVHPIAALQTEYPLWTRDPGVTGTLAACRKNGVAFVACSPPGRGFLTGAFTKPEALSEGDYRRRSPRLTEKTSSNLKLVEKVQALAASKGVTASHVAFAWVLAQGEDIIPISGTKRRSDPDRNIAALDVMQNPAELSEINEAFAPDTAAGMHCPESLIASVSA